MGESEAGSEIGWNSPLLNFAEGSRPRVAATSRRVVTIIPIRPDRDSQIGAGVVEFPADQPA